VRISWLLQSLSSSSSLTLRVFSPFWSVFSYNYNFPADAVTVSCRFSHVEYVSLLLEICGMSAAFVSKLVGWLSQVGHYHHPLPKMDIEESDVTEADEPDHRTAPVFLRHMLSHTQWHHMSQSRAVGATSQDTAGTPVTGSDSLVNGVKMNKSVSFAKVESSLGGEWLCCLLRCEGCMACNVNSCTAEW